MAKLLRIIFHRFSWLLQWLGNLHFPFTHKQLKFKEYEAILMIAQRGDILLTRTRGEISNLGIPGYWKHGGIYRAKNSVFHATGVGTHVINLADFIMSRDSVVVLRPKDESVKIALGFMDFFKEFDNKPYDYAFRYRNDEYTCAELLAALLRKANNGIDYVEPVQRFGVDSIAPNDFFDLDKFDIVYEKLAQ